MAYSMEEAKHYTSNFFEGHGSGAFTSAGIVLPIVNGFFHPDSVIDIGCGVGNWLKVWNKEIGVEDYFGVEGPYITKDLLQIPAEKVLLTDLKQNLKIDRRFDLAMSLEVAEHLPESSSDHFVDMLTKLSDIILFSASIPGQDGTYHINEQTPEYWALKFSKKGYVVLDCIRDSIWNNNKVEWWYQQNIFVFIKSELLANYPELIKFKKSMPGDELLRIHPWIYFYNVQQYTKTKTLLGFIKWKLYPVKAFIKRIFK